VAIDARCVKALFRRGCAHLELKQFEEARRDLSAALEVEPKNTAVKNKLVDAERTQMEEAKRAKGANNYDRFAHIDLSDDDNDDETAKASSSKTPPAGSPTQPAKPPTATSPSPPPPAPPAPKEAQDADQPSKYEKKSGTGYRYWATSTSAPRVIPQKIDPNEAPKLAQQGSGSGSVWNAAGTYEERDQTEWAKAHLREALTSISLALDDGSTARCTAMDSFEGDAGVHLVRGKKRFIWDVRFTIKFEVDLKDAEKMCKGEIEVTDFSSDDPSDWEANLRWKDKLPPSQHARAVEMLGKGIQSDAANTICGCVRAELLRFIAALKER